MAAFECAICGNIIQNALVCRACKNNWDLTEPWARALIRIEQDQRNLEAVEQDRNIVSFTDCIFTGDGQSYNFWDALDIGYKQPGEGNYYFYPEEGSISFQEILQICKRAGVSEKELTALKMWNKSLTSEEAAKKLSKVERKKVSSEAYRKRLESARRKIKEHVGNPTRRLLFKSK